MVLDELNIIEDEFFHSMEYTKNPILVHYTSPEGLMSILTNQTLWFSKWNLLNDKSEGSHIFTVLKDVLKQYERFFSIQVGALCANIAPEIFQTDTSRGKIDLDCRENDISFVCSFSTNKDSLPLWNYYTKNDKYIGYNIVFDSSKLIDNIYPLNTDFYFTPIICNVLYKLDEQTRVVQQIVEKYYKFWKTANSAQKHKILERLVYLIDDIRFLFKHPAFEPEQEVRIILRLSTYNFNKGVKNNKVYIRRKDGYFIPYIPLKCIPQNAIKEIWISPSNDGKGVIDGVKDLLQFLSIKADIKSSKIPLRY